MADINNDLETRLRSAAPDFILPPNFTDRIMMNTVHRTWQAKIERQKHHQLRLAGVSMILAGFLIMVAQIIPINQDIKDIKTTLELTANQASPQNMSWFSWQPIKIQNRGDN